MEVATTELPRAPASKPAGHPLDYDPAKIAQFLASLRTGMALTHALADAGIPSSTYYRWLDLEAAGGYPQLAGLRENVQRARVQAAKQHVQNITHHSEQDWKASAWLLARTFPEEYAERSSVQVNHTGGPTVNIAVLNMDMLPAIAGLLGAPVIDTTSSDVEDIPQREDM